MAKHLIHEPMPSVPTLAPEDIFEFYPANVSSKRLEKRRKEIKDFSSEAIMQLLLKEFNLNEIQKGLETYSNEFPNEEINSLLGQMWINSAKGLRAPSRPL